MKTLADECLALLAGAPLTAKEISQQLGAEAGDVRVAIIALADGGLAKAFTAGRGAALHLATLAFDGRICVMCRALFELPRKSKRLTCGRVCANQLRWSSPGYRERVAASISKAQKSPAAIARTAAHNQRRWANPAARQLQSERSLKLWRDPYQRAAMEVAIKRAQADPALRAIYAKTMKNVWRDPEKRQAIIKKQRATKATPKFKAAFSEQMKERWRDPALREKYTQANRRRNEARFGKKNAP